MHIILSPRYAVYQVNCNFSTLLSHGLSTYQKKDGSIKFIEPSLYFVHPNIQRITYEIEKILLNLFYSYSQFIQLLGIYDIRSLAHKV